MNNKKEKAIGIGLLLLEVTLLFTFFSFIPSEVIAIIGNPSANVQTWLEIGNVYPDILNVSINNDVPIILTPNATTTVSCVALIRDYNGESDIAKVNATFYDPSSTSTSPDNPNNHYTNSTCALNYTVPPGYKGIVSDDIYHTLANCTFEVEYYANASTWTCNVTVEDNMTWADTEWDTEDISTMLAIGLPDIINYTKVNATEVSPEQIANVTNYGNTQLNLTLDSFGETPSDNLAMNCTLGNIGTIDAMYQKYNLTAAGPAQVASLTDFDLTYINMTGNGTVATKQFELPKRIDPTPGVESIKPTYWRIYVPKGVAGTCTGTVTFGATTAIGN